MNQGLMVRDAEVVNDHEIEELRSEVRQLRAALSQANADLSRARKESTRALTALRKQLGPLYQALQMVFGELDAAGVDDTGAGPTDSRTSKVWDNWKSRMGSAAKIIDALLLHGEMNTQQLAIATGYHRTTIPAMIFKLNKAGLLNKNGGRFSLKSL